MHFKNVFKSSKGVLRKKGKNFLALYITLVLLQFHLNKMDVIGSIPRPRAWLFPKSFYEKKKRIHMVPPLYSTVPNRRTGPIKSIDRSFFEKSNIRIGRY